MHNSMVVFQFVTFVVVTTTTKVSIIPYCEILFK